MCMEGDNTMNNILVADNILAVPCDQPLVLSKKESAKLLTKIRNKKPLSDEEKKRRKAEIMALFRKRD